MIPRTLRAANFGLYIGCVLFIIFAVVYVAYTKQLSPLAWWGVVVASFATCVWGISYIFFSIRVDAEGIIRRSIIGSKRAMWRELTDVVLTETDDRGIASCHLELSFGSHKIVLSTDLLHIDDIKDLVSDLKATGLMKSDDDTSK